MGLEESVMARLRPGRRVPTGPLGRYVAEIFAVTRSASQAEHVGLPQGFADVVFRLFSTSVGASSDLHAVGTQKHAFRVAVSDHPVTVVIRFRPGGAHSFFRVPMRELANEVVPIEEIWGADGTELHVRMMDQPDTQAWLTLIETSLRARMQRFDAFEATSTAVATRALCLMARERGPLNVRDVAHEVGISERQLRRQFDDAVGIGPKAFLRVDRFRRALRAAERQEEPRWAQIATGTGYYDQAHLIADCRSFTGMAPSPFLRTLKVANGPATSPLQSDREGA